MTTWETSGSYEHGGGATWTSYSLDAAAGLLLVPVGNPGPDFANQVRPGMNLFTNSFVALDALDRSPEMVAPAGGAGLP